MFKKFMLIVSSAILVAGCGAQKDKPSQTPTSTQETVDFGSSNDNKPIEFTIVDANGVDVSVYKPDFSEYYYLDESSDYVKGITFNEALKFFGSDFTGLVFYGYPTCAFCNEAFPVAVELSNQMQQPLYYVNVHMEGYGPDETSLNEFEKVAYAWYQDDGEGGKSFFVPTLFAIVNGEIVDAHTGLLSGVSIDTTQPLSQEHHDMLASEYQRLFDPVK